MSKLHLSACLVCGAAKATDRCPHCRHLSADGNQNNGFNHGAAQGPGRWGQASVTPINKYVPGAATAPTSCPRLPAREGQRTAGFSPSPGRPASQGQSTAGTTNPSPWAAGSPGAKHHRLPTTTAHLDSQWAQVAQSLNQIAATAIERRVAAKIFKVHGPASAQRVIAAFRGNHPADKQRQLFGASK